MEQVIQWKQGFFKRNITILFNQEPVGEIAPSMWSYKLKANIKETSLLFTVKGLFKHQIILSNPETQAQLGAVSFNFWHSKATITMVTGKVYQWQYTNFWNTYWELTGQDNTRILYHGYSSKGELIIKQGDHLLALIGLIIPIYLHESNESAE